MDTIQFEMTSNFYKIIWSGNSKRLVINKKALKADTMASPPQEYNTS